MNDDVNIAELHSFVLERVGELPLGRRIIVLRALAAVVGDQATARSLTKHVRTLQRIEREHRQLTFRFKQRRSKP